MGNEPAISVEVVYAEPQRQHLERIQVAAGSTARQAIEASTLLQRFPDIDLSENRIGVYGRLIEPDTVVEDGDRVEVYRPLKVDPKSARRQRAMQRKTAERSK